VPSFNHPFFRQQTAVQLYTSLLIPHHFYPPKCPISIPPPPHKNHTIEFRASRKVYYYYTSLKLNESHIIPLKNNQILVVHDYILKSDEFVVFASKMQFRGLTQTSDCILAAYCFFLMTFSSNIPLFSFLPISPLFFLGYGDVINLQKKYDMKKYKKHINNTQLNIHKKTHFLKKKSLL